jgi:3-oxoacyl-[acyl-carrier-protein] synthase-1
VTFAGGTPGPALAIHKALQALRTRNWSRCLIGAFDSLVDANALEWLHDARRLRVPDKPDGIIPGEAASFILLERFDEARDRGANIQAVVTEAAFTHESHHYMARRTSTALALAEAISQVLSTSYDPAPDQAWLIGDHNGETYRAHEWGCLLVRLAARFPSLRVNDTWFPASSFGDTGAASMALGICMAVRAFRRGYHRAPTALITSSSDTGPRGALRIGQHETI